MFIFSSAHNLIWSLVAKLSFWSVLLILLSAYVVAAYYYLRIISRRYLRMANLTEVSIDERSLRSNQEIRESLQDAETINLLVLTGGGVRGIIPLKVLSEVERLTGKKTGELFHFMAGSSTGAINCGILSVPDGKQGYKFSAADVVRDYHRNLRKMFSAPFYHKIFTLLGLLGPRYLPHGKLAVLRGYFGETTLADLPNNLLVPVYDVTDNELKIIRNWEPAINGNYRNFRLLDLINGASSPPMLFSPQAFKERGQPHVFIDPGVVINNPADVALLNAWFMFPNKRIRIVLISNGANDSGKYGHSHMAEFGAYGLFQYLLNSPVISSKFSTTLVNEYIHEARDYGLKVDFVCLDAPAAEPLATGNISTVNMARIDRFAERLIAQNQDKIEYLARVLSSEE